MRSTKDIEHALKHSNLEIDVHAQADQRVLDELVARHRNSMGARRAIRRPQALPFMTKAIAAAAVVVIAALLARHPVRREPAPTPPRRATVSAAELLTVRRLNTVYRRAGMQGLERQCKEAADRVDIRPTRMSIENLIAEFNGSQILKGFDHEDSTKNNTENRRVYGRDTAGFGHGHPGPTSG